MVVGVGYAIGVSFTHPFTLTADVITAVPLVLAAGLTLWTLVRVGSSTSAPSTGAGAGYGDGQVAGNRWVHLWWVLIAAVAAWEIYCFTNLPRHQHPTLSVLIDMLDSTHVGKTVGFGAWLALGWLLVAR
jgi:hypothetical protein